MYSQRLVHVMSQLVSWCFAPSQPLRITPGLGYRCELGLLKEVDVLSR